MTATPPRVLIVTEHASFRFGGEAILPAHYFKGLRDRGVECWLITHERTRPELDAAFANDRDRITYVPDTRLVKTLYRLSKPLPDRLSYFTLGWLIRLLNQRTARKLARRLVAEHRIDVVHQPIPVSPKEPTLLHTLGAPLVIGPMNGGMHYPPDYAHYDRLAVRLFGRAAAALVPLLHAIMPGKRRAAMLLVANDRTRAALPIKHPRIETLVENGVDLRLWQPRSYPADAAPAAPTRFLFAGRLIRLKGVDLLLEATRLVRDRGHSIHLEIAGDGPLRADLERKAAALNLTDTVTFAGWVDQAALASRMAAADVFVLPSLHECGGAVVLEAMATALPTIALDWGGPADYLDTETGLLLPPAPRGRLIASLADAMAALATDPARRRTMGEAARRKVEREYDWNQKIDRILACYAAARGK